MRLRHAVMRARGAAAVAVSLIDNGVDEDPQVLLAKVRAELIRGYNDAPLLHRVPCARGHEWWTSTEAAGCPECRTHVDRSAGDAPVTGRSQQPRRPGANPSAGEATTPGRAGSPTPSLPPARAYSQSHPFNEEPTP